MTTTTRYDAAYSLPSATATTNDHAATQDLGPQTLAEVIETCRAAHASATLYDAVGSIRGYVHADGNYSLR